MSKLRLLSTYRGKGRPRFVDYDTYRNRHYWSLVEALSKTSILSRLDNHEE